MAPIRRLVLDMLKPHDPPTYRFAGEIADLAGVDGVNAVLVEVDEDVENIKLTIEGEAIDFDAVEDTIETLGGTIHSVDMAACGDRIVEQRATPQD
jgi:hypothetical protein